MRVIIICVILLLGAKPTKATDICPQDDNGNDFIECPQTYKETPGFEFIPKGKKVEKERICGKYDFVTRKCRAKKKKEKSKETDRLLEFFKNR